MKRLVLLDTDPGIDDAMAILFGLRSPELELIGLTAVFGNTDVETTAQNALRLVELEGNGHIPVAKGASRPLFTPGSLGQHVHGADGLGETHPPAPRGSLQPVSAAEMIVSTLREHPGQVSLVAVGPLTNLALALRLEPRITQWVKEVVIMGGAATVPGNVNAVAEANICNDPYAAAIVFSADWPLTMVGLDVTTQVVMTQAYLDSLYAAHNPATECLARILPHYQKFHADVYGMAGSIHTHDPSAIAFLLDPGLFHSEAIPVFVETQGHCAGFTVPDRQHRWPESHPVNVCLGVNAAGLLSLFKERLTTEPRR